MNDQDWHRLNLAISVIALVLSLMALISTT